MAIRTMKTNAELKLDLELLEMELEDLQRIRKGIKRNADRKLESVDKEEGEVINEIEKIKQQLKESE